MALASGRPEKESYLLVTFRHGDPDVFERYTDWTQENLGHVSTPSMEVEIPENTGTFDERECRILLPLDDFTSVASSGRPHSPIYVTVEETTAGLFAGDAGSTRTLFIGRVVRASKNWQGRADTAAFFALPAKSRLKRSMGLQCNHHCIWQLFGPGCRGGTFQASAFRRPGQIASVDGQEITIMPDASIENPATPGGGSNDRFWERGYLERDGLRIDVARWVRSDDPKVFVLRNRPPDSWILAGAGSVIFYPGCHKTIEDCRDTWDREERFQGLGYAMLPYNPNIESPQ